MGININVPDDLILKPIITVFGVGGAGGNALNNMIASKLEGVRFIAANTDAQALEQSLAENKIQLGRKLTQGLGAGSNPLVGSSSAEESLAEILQYISDSHMIFVAAGMGGGTGTGAAAIIARAAKDKGILTIGVITKPFNFEGKRRQRVAEEGIVALRQHVDTLITIPNQNLFKIADEKTTFSEAFKLADRVLYSGIQGITDLMVRPGLINLDFADIKTVMNEMGNAVMGTGEAEGENRAVRAAEGAIYNPLFAYASMKGAKGMLINVSGGEDITLFEVDEAANRIRKEVENEETNVIFGSTFSEELKGRIRVSIVATGIDARPTSPRVVLSMKDEPSAITSSARKEFSASVSAVTDSASDLVADASRPRSKSSEKSESKSGGWLGRFVDKIATHSRQSKESSARKAVPEAPKVLLEDNIYKVPSFMRRKKENVNE